MASGEDQSLKDEITRLLAVALESDTRHVEEMHRRDELHIREVDRRDTLHHDEIQRRADHHEEDLRNITTALETRDLIGQAKGILMATLGISADRAFGLIRSQSQHENRKVIEIASEIVDRASRPQTRRAQEPPTTIG